MAKPSGKSTKVALSMVVVEPHKKRKIIRSQMQGLSQMARGDRRNGYCSNKKDEDDAPSRKKGEIN